MFRNIPSKHTRLISCHILKLTKRFSWIQNIFSCICYPKSSCHNIVLMGKERGYVKGPSCGSCTRVAALNQPSLLVDMTLSHSLSLCIKRSSSVMFMWTLAFVNTILGAQRDLHLAVRSGNCGFVFCGWNRKRHWFIVCREWHFELRVHPLLSRKNMNDKPGIYNLTRNTFGVAFVCLGHFSFKVIDRENTKRAEAIHDLWGMKKP